MSKCDVEIAGERAREKEREQERQERELVKAVRDFLGRAKEEESHMKMVNDNYSK